MKVIKETCGENLTWTLEDGTLIISGNGSMKNLRWDERAPWREYDKWIKTVLIRDGVTTIGGSVFDYCSSLTSITIPDSATTIGYSAFERCSSLKIIRCPARRVFKEKLSAGNNAKMISYTGKTPPAFGTLWWTVADNTLIVGGVREIKNYSAEKPPWFDKLSGIQNIVIDYGVKILSAHAFDNCPNLKEI